MAPAIATLARRSRSAIRAAKNTFFGDSAPPSSGDIPVRPHLLDRGPYFRNAARILKRHSAQTADDVAGLCRKYQTPIFGKIGVWELVQKLALCIDPSDGRLFCTSQLVHVFQILDEMEADGVANDEFILAALVHDLGKVLLLVGERPENVVGFNDPIGTYEPGCGLHNCTLQWNHDELAYSRVKDHLPEGLAWLVRYHSINRTTCDPYMDEKDRAYSARYWDVFERYDHGTKSPVFLPKLRIDKYRSVVEKAFPHPIVF